MQIFVRNLSVFAVFALLAMYVWLFGGTRGEYLPSTIPWVMAFLAEVLLFFPQQHSGETTYEARERVWSAINRDPLKTLVICFALLMAVPFFNAGLCPVCDAQAVANGVPSDPKIPFVPFCVNRMHHLNTVLWYVPTFLAVLVVKHSLLKRGRRMLLELVVWNGFALAVLGLVQQATGAEGPLWIAKQNVYFFSVFGYPNMAGDYFTTLFALSVAIWRWRIDEAHELCEGWKRDLGGFTSAKTASGGSDGVNRAGENADRPFVPPRFWRRHYMAIPTVMSFVAVISTLCRASILLVVALALVFMVHAFVCLFSRLRRVQRVKACAAALLFVIVAVFSVYLFVPDEVRRELSTVNAGAVLGRVSGKSEYNTRLASSIWKDHLLFGCGGWGYGHLLPQYMTKEDYKGYYPTGAINVHNDTLQILTEHGVVGFGLMLVVFLLLLKPILDVWRALYANTRFMSPKERPPRPAQLFVLPAPAFCVLAGAVATYVHSFGECPFRSPAIFALFFLSIAAVDGFLPTMKPRD